MVNPDAREIEEWSPGPTELFKFPNPNTQGFEAAAAFGGTRTLPRPSDDPSSGPKLLYLSAAVGGAYAVQTPWQSRPSHQKEQSHRPRPCALCSGPK